MLTVSHLHPQAIEHALQEGLLTVHVGPYTYQLQSHLPTILEGITSLYRDFPLAETEGFIDYDISVGPLNLLSRLRSQTHFLFDKKPLFGPIPKNQAYAVLEWGMNWCVSNHAHEYLNLHAAVVEKDGRALIMPGLPGAGKSTLCAALGLSGYRILSDEHAMVTPGTNEVTPVCRPVSLKNESIELIKAFDSTAIFGPVSEDTHKGNVAHMKADLVVNSHDTRPLPSNLMLFPRYSREEPQQLRPRRRTTSFVLAAYHSFNYSVLGVRGYEAMKSLIDKANCYDMTYHDIEWAIRTIDQLYGETDAI